MISTLSVDRRRPLVRRGAAILRLERMGRGGPIAIRPIGKVTTRYTHNQMCCAGMDPCSVTLESPRPVQCAPRRARAVPRLESRSTVSLHSTVRGTVLPLIGFFSYLAPAHCPPGPPGPPWNYCAMAHAHQSPRPAPRPHPATPRRERR
jgi:hypothetical protein